MRLLSALRYVLMLDRAGSSRWIRAWMVLVAIGAISFNGAVREARAATAANANANLNANANANLNSNLNASANPLDVEPHMGGMPFSTTGPEVEAAREDYPHIFSTDVWDTNDFWYTERPNILNQTVSKEWDAVKIINTDRPDFTDVATVVGKGVLQIETGYTFHYHTDGQIRTTNNTAPESLFRYGTSDRFEWRMKWTGYSTANSDDVATGARIVQQGYSDMVLGFKWIAIPQDDWRPLQTIVTRMTVPFGSQGFSSNTVLPGATYIYNWQVRRWWFIRGSSGFDYLRTAGVGIQTDPLTGVQSIASTGHDSSIQGHQTVSSYFQISQRLGMFAEVYMLYHHGAAVDRPDYFHDYGLYAYITPNFQLDARIGQRLDHEVGEWFTGAGVSGRF
jgi:hypothetical protein